MKTKKPHCLSCEKKPARRLKTTRVHYENARTDPVFCSRVCAADFGLLCAGIEKEGIDEWTGTRWSSDPADFPSSESRIGTDQ